VGINNTGRYSVLDVTDSATYNGNGGLQLGSGSAGNAAFTLRSNGVANISGITMGSAGQNNATVVTQMLLSLQGGTLNVGAGGIVAGTLPTTGAGFATTINAGLATSSTALTIGALADWSSPLKMTLTNSTAAGTPVFRASDNAATPVAHDISLSGILSGTGGLTKTGAGKLTLSGANTYTGATIVKAGTLALGASAQPGVLSGSGFCDIHGGQV
jgi:autotransporter-associated beta strand protein